MGRSVSMKRRELLQAPRAHLERLARYLKLHFDASWSRGHLARLIHWRLNRKRTAG